MYINFLKGSCLLLLSVLFSILIVFIIQFSIYNIYPLEECILTNIDYPKNISYQNEGFISCNNNSYQTCISLFGNIKNNNTTKLIQNNIFNEVDKNCTFRNDQCINNINYEILNNTIKLAEKYKNVIISNKSIDCWNKNNNYYLNNDKYVNIDIFIILGNIITFIILIIILCYYYIKKNKYRLLQN